MSTGMATGGLSLDQAPPLAIPVTFFLTIPAGILVAACILLVMGSAPLISPWAQSTVALTHAGTLGVLAMGMFGALYQMTPVVAGATVSFPRLAHVVHALMLVGLAGLIWRLLGGPVFAMQFAIAGFSVAMLLFFAPLGWALLRPATNNETVQGMRVAVISLVAVTIMGILMARAYAGHSFPADRGGWIQIHLTLALLGWVGGLILSVSWQVIPMFYLAPTCSQKTMRWLFGLLLTGLVLCLLALPFAVLTEQSSSDWAAIGAIPAAVVIWLVHPVLILRNISRRKRKRRDASLLFWRTGLVCGLCLIPLAIAALWLDDPHWRVLFGWVAIWGWAGLIMHGMLCRIVPFLVWFHRYSALVGFSPVPSMRKLLSQRRIQAGFSLHLLSLVGGAVAIVLQSDILGRITGLVLVMTAIALFSMLTQVITPYKEK